MGNFFTVRWEWQKREPMGKIRKWLSMHQLFRYLHSPLNSPSPPLRSQVIPGTAGSLQQNHSSEQVFVSGFKRQIKACSFYSIIFYRVVCSEFAWHDLPVHSHLYNKRIRHKLVISVCGNCDITKMTLLAWQQMKGFKNCIWVSQMQFDFLFLS